MNKEIAWQKDLLQKAIGDVINRARLHDMYSGYGAKIYHTLSEYDNAECGSVISACVAKMHECKGRLRAVDMCAGSGRITAELSAIGIDEIYAVDFSDDLLNVLERRKLQNVTAVKSDIISWLFQQDIDSLDIAIIAAGSLRLFNHNQRVALFTQLRKVLRKDGIFWFSHELIAQSNVIFFPCEVDVEDTRLSAVFLSCPSIHDNEKGSVNGYLVASSQDASIDLYLSWVRQITSQTLIKEVVSAGFADVSVVSRIAPRRMADERKMLFFTAR